MTSAVIVSTARTPLAQSWKGAFNMTHGATLGGHAVKAAVERAGIAAAVVDDGIMGCATPEGATGRNLARRLARFESGERVTATVFRGDELVEVGMVLKPAPLDTCYLTVRDQADPKAVERRRAWLGE